MLELILEYRDEAQSVLAWLICLAALRWGGGPERGVAIVWLVVFKGMDFAYHQIWGLPFRLDQVDIFHALIEFLAATGFILIALNGNRFYTLWIAAFQVIATSAHVVRELVDTVSPLVYAIMVTAPSYFQLFIFAGGLLFHIRRKRQHGPYRDWLDPTWLSFDRMRSALGKGGLGRRPN